MSFINWTKQELTNINVIDKQHIEITTLINDVYESNARKKKKVQLDFTKKLIEKLREHFETEEQFMKDYSDSGFYSHMLEHQRLLSKVILKDRKLRESNAELDEEFFQSMRKWFYNHLDFKDSKLARHLSSKGVK